MSFCWYPFYPGDYARDTQDLSCCEHGCYRLLLDSYWTRGPLPDDLNRLCRLAAGCEAETVRFILERYWQRTDAGWVNQRMEKLRAEREDNHKRHSEAGKKGNLARWGGKDRKAIARGSQGDRQGIANQNQNHTKKGSSLRSDPKEKSQAKNPWIPPPMLNLEAWGEFESHRREIRKPMTDMARAKNANLLVKYDRETQQLIVDQTIANRWQGLFPVTPSKCHNPPGRQTTRQERTVAAVQTWLEGQPDDA